MSGPIISVENLSKCYVIGHQRNGSDGLRHALEKAARKPLKWLRDRRRASRATREEFWSLRDVSFEVQQGEVVGIIGRNGAGKSTLLKILSRITEPTQGRVEIEGRVASLLEVGTGFHQELTGRENIFLNGAILGMTKAEIKRKFDEIVAFAEIERFIDTPVKHYSSGMYVRLAFAVAAHLEPEILVVDEVLAVGDIAFQQKCMGRMGEVARGGRTILFVSHNMAAIQQLCSRAVVLDSGRVLINGPTSTAMNAYLDSIRSAQSNPLHLRTDRKGNGELRFTRVSLLSDAEEEVSSATCGESIRIRLHYKSHFHGQECSVSVAFKLTNESGVVLTTFANIQTGQPRLRVHREGFFECVWPKANIRSGTYDCTIFCAVDGETCDWIQHAFTILFEDGDFYGTGQLVSRGHGDIVCEHHWQSVEEYEKGPFHEIPFSAPRRSLS